MTNRATAIPSHEHAWQRGVLLFLLLPLFAGIFQCTLFGLLDRILLFSGHWLAYVTLLLLGALLLLSLRFIMWRGRFSAAMAVFALVVLIMFALPPNKMNLLLRMDSDTGISINRNLALHGTDVYCNDVHLDKIPLHLSVNDFHTQVLPQTAPPGRILAASPEDIFKAPRPERTPDTPQRGWWMSHVPYDVFQGYRRSGIRGHAEGGSLQDACYWWRFTREGVEGLTQNKSFGYVQVTDESGRPVHISLDPEIHFPSLNRHVTLLVHSLRQSGGVPSEQWVQHVQDYWDLVFPALHERGQSDPELSQALQHVVRQSYGIHEAMSKEDVERAFERVMMHVERTGLFTVPSAESIGIDLLGERASEAIEKQYRRLSHVPPRARYARERRGSDREVFPGKGKSARIPPLEYAILQARPAGLLNQLVYDEMTSFLPAISLIAAYPQPEAVKLVTHMLQRSGHGLGGRSEEIRRQLLMQAAPAIRNPKLDLFIYDFMRQNRDPVPTGRMVEFIESRLDATWTDGAQLYEWFIRHLPEGDQIRYLTRLRSPHTGNYLRGLIRNDEDKWADALAELERHSNPDLDGFLIEAHGTHTASKTDSYPSALPQAMLICDTPKMRAYLDALWEQGGETRRQLLIGLRQLVVEHPEQARWLDSLVDLALPAEQLSAIPVLAQIGTPSAVDVLNRWSEGADRQVAQESTKQLERLHADTQQAAQLIAGQLHPNELSPPVPTYIWSGKEYVREGRAVP